MYDEKEWLTDPNEFIAFKNPHAQPPTLFYVLRKDIDKLVKTTHLLPNDPGDFSGDSSNYFKNTNGVYGGRASIAYFLFSPEIIAYLQNDEDFINRCIEEKAIAFLPQDVTDIFVF